MDENDPKSGPIQPPKKFPENQAARRIAKAVAGSIPHAGAALAEVVDARIPDYEARDRERWEGDVTEGVNDLHGRVDDLDQRSTAQTISLEGASALIAKFMIEGCSDGLMSERVTLADVQAAHPEFSKEELADGFGDLESYGWIEKRALIGAPARYRLTQQGYEALDKPVLGFDTMADARKIAAIVVRERENIRTADLEAELGWSRRQLNPALRIVVDFIHPGRVSQSIQPDYVTRYFSPSDAELAQLRRFAAGA